MIMILMVSILLMMMMITMVVMVKTKITMMMMMMMTRKNIGLSSCWCSPDGNSGGQDHSATPTNIFHNNSHNILHISIHPNIYQMAKLMIIVIILMLS